MLDKTNATFNQELAEIGRSSKWVQYPKSQPLPDEKTKSKTRSEGKSRKKKRETIPNGNGVEEAIDDPHRLARLYLSEYRHTIHWRQDWYFWTDPAYTTQTEDDIKAQLVEVLKEEADWQAERLKADGGEAFKITKTLLANVLECLKALCNQRSHKEEPFWL